LSDLKRYIEFNGSYFQADAPIFKCNNRAMLYGDALFETMVAFKGKIPFIRDHIQRLVNSMELMMMNIPVRFNEQFFEGQVSSLLNRNKHFMGARLRLTVFRNEGGLYAPDTNDVSYILESNPLSNDQFMLNEKGLKIDVFTEHKKPIHAFSGIKSTNALLFVLAGVYKKKIGIDECIILNGHGNICESMSSNIFLAKEGKLYTPSPESGCLNGVMRKQVIQLARKANIQVEETPMLTLEHVRNADECFLTNAVNGIRWVGGFQDVRYFKKISGLLVGFLNRTF
jgi:branched-subunit amino acid aminotransferase/4-amino-4-deoxychorismate lyase